MHSDTPSRGRVAILAGVFNGGTYLAEQIASWSAQTHPHIDLFVSDDGSTDDSVSLLTAAMADWTKGSFQIRSGPGRGFAENFRSLLTNGEIDADYFAFSDQDDIWAPEKLEIAVGWLAQQSPSVPALYCSRTRVVDGDGRHVGYSRLFARQPSFRNAMVQSLAGGNTMVMNRCARDLVAEASRRSGFVSHDWWCYLIVTGAGGVVHYAPEPAIDYRQHPGNLVGENASIMSKLGRSSFLYRGGFAAWMDRNIAGLKACRDLLTDDARRVLDQVTELRRKALLPRLYALYQSGVYRQSRTGQIGLFLACAANRL